MGSSDAISVTKPSTGWGWYVLIGIMAKFTMPMKFLNGFSIVIEIFLFCGIVYYYFKKRAEIYSKEYNLSGFRMFSVSLRAGFYSLLLYLIGLFATGLLDRFASRL